MERIVFTDHALERIEERLVPLWEGSKQTLMRYVTGEVDAAIERNGLTRKPPQFVRGHRIRRGTDVRYVRFEIGGGPACAVVSIRESNHKHVVITVVVPSRAAA